MPEINLIPEVLYSGEQPYHIQFDNLPLKNILTRIDLVNVQVDLNSAVLRNAVGSAGNLANRLNKSLEESGSLKTQAVDNALHNIAEHTDGSSGGIAYVRMLESERDKLTLVESEANALDIEIESISTTETLTSGVARFRHSDTITWELIAPDIIKAHSIFPEAAAHQHHYDLEPAHADVTSPDYTNYKTTGASTAFIDGSLRVYVNGIRLSTSDQVYVPGPTGPDGTWFLTGIASTSAAAGTFALNRAIDPDDVIRIDFDQQFM